MHSLFFEIGLVIISASVIGLLGHRLRQPLILAYIAAGILIGPMGFNLVESMEVMHFLAQIGIMLMLFLVGLEMNTDRLRHLGPVALLAGGGQVLITSLLGYGLSVLFGFTWMQALYIALALGFSSTVIAIKLIYDKKDGNTLYAQASISILLFQDFLAIVALFLLSGLHQGQGVFSALEFLTVMAKGALLVTFALVMARKFLGYICSRIASSAELLILFSLSWAFAVALISEAIGFGVEIGAFLAGVSLAGLPYAFEISVKGKVIRDFFITIFFVALGAGMVFSSIAPFAFKIILFSLLLLVGNPIIVTILMNLLGYEKRSAFFTGLAIANIGEFSLILMAMGLTTGYLDQQIVSMMTVVVMVTMLLSSYAMTYNNWLYSKLKPLLGWLEIRRPAKRLSGKQSAMKNHIVLIGCGQMGEQILEQLKGFKEELLVADHDARVIERMIKSKIPCVFGDIEDEELLAELDLEHAELVISTVMSVEDTLSLARHLSKLPEKNRPPLIVTAETGREGMMLFRAGADYVILKPYLGAAHVHQINRSLYGLKDDSPLAAVQDWRGRMEEVIFERDYEYARFLHGLNGLRLEEIRRGWEGKGRYKSS